MQEDKSKHLPDSWFKTSINGDEWTIYLAEDEDDVIADDGSAAETDFASREIYVRKSDLDLNVVRHELWHAFAGYTYLEDTDISVANCEEVAACLFADRGSLIINKADECYKRLCELRDNG